MMWPKESDSWPIRRVCSFHSSCRTRIWLKFGLFWRCCGRGSSNCSKNGLAFSRSCSLSPDCTDNVTKSVGSLGTFITYRRSREPSVPPAPIWRRVVIPDTSSGFPGPHSGRLAEVMWFTGAAMGAGMFAVTQAVIPATFVVQDRAVTVMANAAPAR